MLAREANSMRCRLLSLLAIVCLDVMACRPSGPRFCPEGMSLDSKQSKPGQVAWCRGKDGRRVQYIEFHSGGKEKRQLCEFREGRADGPFVAWFPDGAVWIRGQFTAGHPDGRWNQWDKAGSRVAEGEYRSGRFVAGAPVAGSANCDKLQVP
jgi:hypothetical protein